MDYIIYSKIHRKEEISLLHILCNSPNSLLLINKMKKQKSQEGIFTSPRKNKILDYPIYVPDPNPTPALLYICERCNKAEWRIPSSSIEIHFCGCEGVLNLNPKSTRVSDIWIVGPKDIKTRMRKATKEETEKAIENGRKVGRIWKQRG